jgi:hypothetical protein
MRESKIYKYDSLSTFILVKSGFIKLAQIKLSPAFLKSIKPFSYR